MEFGPGSDPAIGYAFSFRPELQGLMEANRGELPAWRKLA
jgi:hypothetical protein